MSYSIAVKRDMRLDYERWSTTPDEVQIHINNHGFIFEVNHGARKLHVLRDVPGHGKQLLGAYDL